MKLPAKSFLAALLLGTTIISACTSLPHPTQSNTAQTNTTQTQMAEVKDLASMNDVKMLTEGLQAKYGAKNVLIVFDIDDTLLTSHVDLGSTAWWNWQGKLAKTDPAYLPFGRRLAVANTAFSLSELHPVEGPTTVNFIHDLTAAGSPVFALTARGPDNRDATLRELHRNGLDFTSAPECGAPLCVKRGILDGDKIVVPLARKRFGFKDGEKTRDIGKGPLKLSARRPVSVSDGVMMVSGQNKGVMLRLLVDSLKGTHPKAIVFVDDSTHNIENAKAASPAFSEALYIIHYTANTKDQQDFMSNRKREKVAADELKELSNAVCDVFDGQAPICP